MAKRKRSEYDAEELQAMPLPELDNLLTHKEYAFVQGLLEGLTRRRAYKKAYPDCKASERVVDTKAYELFNRGVVRVSYERHLEKMRKEQINIAFLRGRRAGKELENIAYGTKKYPDYTKGGQRIEKEPTLSQRIEALKEIKKDAGEILKADIYTDRDSGVLKNILEQLGESNE